MKPLTDPIGLVTFGFRARVIEILPCQIAFILMPFRGSPVFRAPIG